MADSHDPSRRLTVAEVMTTDVVTVSTSTPVKEAAGLMSQRRIAALPVIGADGTLVGIISETDFIGKRVDAEVVGELMSAPVVTAGPDDPVPLVARILLARNVKSLPVVDDSTRVVGIVSRADLLKVFLRSDRDIRRDVIASVAASAIDVEPPGIGITVTDGVVTLTGTVRTTSDIRRVTTAAIAVSGVVHVRSDDVTSLDPRGS
ncbi:MAG: CBS domain-containing protein [Candidatus Dormibacteria bacterium]